MSNWQEDITDALRDFIVVAELAGVPMRLEEFKIEFLPAPHKQPTALPTGKMAVYGFCYNDQWLKIGKAGSKTKARFTSQHYNSNSAPSTLANSLLLDPKTRGFVGFDESEPGKWMKQYTNRFNIYISTEKGIDLLSLLEVFLHTRLHPRYEGKHQE